MAAVIPATVELAIQVNINLNEAKSLIGRKKDLPPEFTVTKYMPIGPATIAAVNPSSL